MPPDPPPLCSPRKRTFGSSCESVCSLKLPGRRLGERGCEARGSNGTRRRFNVLRHRPALPTIASAGPERGVSPRCNFATRAVHTATSPVTAPRTAASTMSCTAKANALTAKMPAMSEPEGCWSLMAPGLSLGPSSLRGGSGEVVRCNVRRSKCASVHGVLPGAVGLQAFSTGLISRVLAHANQFSDRSPESPRIRTSSLNLPELSEVERRAADLRTHSIPSPSARRSRPLP